MKEHCSQRLLPFVWRTFSSKSMNLLESKKWHQTGPCSLAAASIGVTLNKEVRLGVLHRLQKEKHAYQSAPVNESTFSGHRVVAGRAEKTLPGVHCVARPARARDFSRARDSVSYGAHIAPDFRPLPPPTSRPTPAASAPLRARNAPARPLLRDFYSRSPPPPPEKARKIRLHLVLKYSEFRAGQD